MTTKTTPPPATESTPAGLLELLRGLPGGAALEFTWWPSRCVEAALTAALAVLAEHPGASRQDLDKLTHVTWARARTSRVGPGDMPLDQALHRSSGATILPELRQMLEVLVAAGDLAQTLTGQRRAIDRLLEQIAQLRTPKA